MRCSWLPLILAPLLTGCASTVAQRISHAAGVDRMDKIERINFTFNVARNGNTSVSRAWTWWPAQSRVMRVVDGQSVTYWRNKMSEEDRAVDAQFINDTFWLSPALHLRWAGPEVSISDEGESDIPIIGETGRRILLAYPKQGGYTPGDAYDLFIDKGHIIRAWHFRRGGAAAPSLTTTFENYVDFGGLQVALEHRNADGSFRLWFTDVKVR